MATVRRYTPTLTYEPYNGEFVDMKRSAVGDYVEYQDYIGLLAKYTTLKTNYDDLQLEMDELGR